MVGIFSQRAKGRPNRIGITAAEEAKVEDGMLTMRGLDAIGGPPVLDIKPYYPMYGCKAGAVVPVWVERLMEYYFDGRQAVVCIR